MICACVCTKSHVFVFVYIGKYDYTHVCMYVCMYGDPGLVRMTCNALLAVYAEAGEWRRALSLPLVGWVVVKTMVPFSVP